MQLASANVVAEGHLQELRPHSMLAVWSNDDWNVFAFSSLSSYTAKPNSCYCSNIHHVEEKNEWPPVTLPFHRIGTSKMIHVINTALIGIVVANYFRFVFLAIYSLVVMQRGQRDSRHHSSLGRVKPELAKQQIQKNDDCFSLSRRGCISFGMSSVSKQSNPCLLCVWQLTDLGSTRTPMQNLCTGFWAVSK